MADDHIKLVKRSIREDFPSMKRETLTLKKPVDPAKIARSLEIGFRFVDRKGRYMLQKHVVTYGERMVSQGGLTLVQRSVVDSTWVDIPLVPETYEAQA